MRLLLEILLIAFIAFIGWRQPFRDLVRTRFPQTGIEPSRLATRALEAEYAKNPQRAPGRSYNQPAPISDGSWMYKERGRLDAPPKPAR